MKRATPLEGGLVLLSVSLGCGLAFLSFGGSTKPESELRRKEAEFVALTANEQQTVTEAFDRFQSYSAARKQQLNGIMKAAEADPKVSRRLQTIESWFLSLPRSEQDVWREKIAAGDATAVSARIQEQQQLASKVIVDFSLGARRFFRQRNPQTTRPENANSNEGIPVLEISIQQYASIIDEAFPNQILTDEEQRCMQELDTLEERCLCKTLYVMGWLRANRFHSSSTEPMVSALEHQMLDLDSGWQQRFADFIRRIDTRSFGRIAKAMAVVSILDQAIIILGARFKDRIHTEQADLINAFAQIDDERLRTRLMAAAPDAARNELQKILMKDQYVYDSARRRLMLDLISYEENLAMLSQSLFGPFGGLQGRGPNSQSQPSIRPETRPD